MDRLPPETRALRQVLTTGCASFLLGWLLCFGLLGYVWFYYIWPHERGSSFITLLKFLLWSMFAGALTTGAATFLLTRWHYRSGFHRCVWCNRARRGPYLVCVCRPKAEHERAARLKQVDRFRHNRRRIGHVLLVYGAILPLSILLVNHGPEKTQYPYAGEVAICHGLLCALLLCLLDMADGTVELFKMRARRFRLRLRVFRIVFMIWPLTMAFFMAWWSA